MSKKTFKVRVVNYLIPALILLLLLFPACDALTPGLGDKVDISIPTLALSTYTSPSGTKDTSSIPYLRGDVTLAGTVSDDRGVSGVTISYKTASGSTNTVNTTVSGTTWTVTLKAGLASTDADYNNSLAEGEQSATITATDTSSKTNTVTASFFVDNKAPAVLATSPLTYGTNLPTFYRTIDLKGEVYDPSPLESVVVNLVSTTGTVLDTKTADGTNTWAVRFDHSGASSPLVDNTVYGYNIIAKDKAGNTNTHFYHRFDIYPLLTAVGGYVTFPSMNELGGLDQKGSGSLSSGLAWSSLNSVRKGSETSSYPDFRFKKTDSPAVQWQNLQVTAGSTYDPAIGTGVPIVGTIMPPSDGSSINPASVVFSIFNSTTHLYMGTGAASGTATKTQTAFSTESVGASLNFRLEPQDNSGTDLPTGSYIVAIKFTTNSGMTGSAQQAFAVSSEAPSLEETGVGGVSNPVLFTTMTKSARTLSGKAYNSDGTPADLTVTVDSGLAQTLILDSQNAYTFAVPAPADHSNDGTHTYVLKATNASGLQTILSRTILIDTTKSTTNITSPAANAWVNGTLTSYTIAGVSDDTATGSGVKAVHVLVTNPGQDHSTDNAYASSPWTSATGTVSWQSSINPLALGEGDFRLWTVTEDQTGNISRSYQDFHIDYAYPRATLSAAGTITTIDGFNATRAAFTLSGIADDDALSPGGTVRAANSATLSWTRNGVTSNTTLSPVAGAWSWSSASANLTDGSHDGLYQFVLSVIDEAGKTTTVNYAIKVDTTPPTLSVSTPVNNAITESASYTIRGSAMDLGVGLDSASTTAITYSLNAAAEDTATLIGTDWTKSLTLSSEGTNTLTVHARDKLGNEAIIGPLTFYYDQAAPGLTETAVGTEADTFRSVGFQLTGTATDSNALQLVTITQVKDGGTAKTILSTAISGNSQTYDSGLNLPRDPASPATSLTGASASGVYVYVVTVTDASGRTTSITRNIKIDQTPPSITAPASVSGYQASTVNISGTAIDNHASASGIKKVEYQVGSTAGAWADTASVLAPGQGTSTWSLALDVSAYAEGTVTVYFRSTDNANLVSSNANTTFEVDRATPQADMGVVHAATALAATHTYTILSTGNTDFTSIGAANSNPGTSFTATGAGTGTGTAIELLPTASSLQKNAAINLGGLADDSLITAGRTASTLVLAVSKDGGTASTQTLTGNGSTPVTKVISGQNFTWTQSTGVWTWTLPAADATYDGFYTLTLTVTDAAGKSLQVSRTIQIDKTPPTLSISRPGLNEAFDASTVVTDYVLKGTTQDPGGTGFDGVADVEYRLSTDGTMDTETWSSLTLSGINWNAGSPALGAEGTKILEVRSTDKVGNTSAVQSINFYYDLAAPSLAETAVGSTDTQFRNADLGFGGTASDTNALSTLKVSVDGGAGITIPIDANGADNILGNGDDNTWTYTYAAGTASEGTHTLVFTATDTALKTTSLTRTVLVDRTAPVLSSITVISGSWKSTASQSISGSAAETGSGLARVEYRISADNGSTWSGWSNMTGTSSFSGTVTFSEGNLNKIEIRGVDKAGNNSTPAAGNNSAQTVWIDTIDPEIASLSITDTAYVNGRSSLAFTLTSIDTASHAATAKARIDSNDFSSGTVNQSIVSDSATITIPAASLAALSDGSHRIYVRIWDNAARFSAIQAINLVKDSTSPTVTFTSHANGATVNKIITYAGTASETNILSSVNVMVLNPATVAATAISAGSYYRIASVGTTDFTVLGASANTVGTSFKALATGTGSGTVSLWVDATTQAGTSLTGSNSWSLSGFDTTDTATWPAATYDADSGTAGTQLRIGALALDGAGNTGSAERLLTIDQDSDKPVVKLTNLATTGTPTLKQTTTIYGSISDDDGTITTLRMKNAIGDSWTTLTMDGQSFTYTVTGVDGNKDLYFEITDAAGTVFTTAAVSSSTTPRLFQSTGVWLETPLAFKLDTVNPTIDPTVGIKVGAAAWGDYATASAYYGGSSSGQFLVRLQASDANGIASATVSVTDSASTTISRTTSFASTYWTTSTSLDVTGLADGTASLQITVVDNSGLSSTLSKTITIDNTAPSGSFLSPSTLTVVNGDLSLKGLANDATSGLASIQYDIGNTGTWASVTSGTYSWQVDFTGAGNINSYATATYAAYNSGDDTWLCPIRIKITDKAGNAWTSGATDYQLKIDPSGDKPKATVIYPYDYTKPVGGTVRIYGSATDDDAVYAMFMQIDADNNGDWTDDTNVSGTNWYNGGLGRQITGQNSWYQNINASGEFNPVSGTKTIQVRVRAQDTKNGTTGDIYGPWVQFPVIFDNNVPKIGNTHPLVLSKNTTYGDGDDVAYTYGSYITGSWYLLGSVEDEGSITSIIVNGGLAAATGGTNSSWFVPNAGNYDLQIPITTAAGSSGNVEFTITGYDNTAPSAREAALNIKLFYDNQAPTGTFTGTSPIVQSDGWYKLKGTALDVGSDIKKVDVYLIRRNTNATDTPAYEYDRFYNPLTGAEIAVGGTDKITTTAGSFVTGATYTIATVGTTNFVAIGASANTVGITFTATGSGSGTGTAYYNYPVAATAALIKVDHKDITEVHGAPITNDDSDGLVESLKQTVGDTYSWYVDIDSSLINDGAVEVHYVIEDMSGNATHYVTAMEVKNNTPSLASVLIGTDLDGSSTITSDEQVLVTTSGSSTDATGIFTAKAAPVTFDLGVTGGNSTLLYTLTCGSVTKNGTLRTGSGGSINTITLDATDMATIGDGTKTFSITVWDSTEEKTAGVDSMSVSKSVSTIVKFNDTTPPVDVISPFFWTSTGSNSLYNYSRDNGHIEINGVVDSTDPDVSGKVTLRGTAYDDQRLTEIYLYIDGFTFTGNLGTKSIYDSVTSGNLTYAKVASYSAGTWTTSGNLATNGWLFTVTSSTFGQDGHHLTWQLDWDSSKISGVAGLNKVIRLATVDKGANTSATSLTAAGAESVKNVPYYQVDVVPYVRAISRAASYSTIRSREGRYVVSRGENVTVSGFNVYNSTADSVTFGTASAAGTGYTSASASSFVVPVPATASSGAVSISVSGVGMPNNLNVNSLEYNNEASVSSALDGSVLWTDDRKVHVWVSDNNQATANFGYFTNSNTPIFPALTYNAGTLYASWSNLSASTAYYGNNSNTGSRVSIFGSYDPMQDTDISYGSRLAVVYNADTYNNGGWSAANAGGVQIWDANLAAGTFYNGEELFHNSMLGQFVHPRIVTNGNYNHITYYDTATKALKYQNIPTSSSTALELTNWVNLDGGYDYDDLAIAGMTTVIYNNSAAATAVNATNTGAINVSYVAVGSHQTATTRIARVNTTNYNLASNGVIISLTATTTAAVGTQLYTYQPDTTISTLPVTVGSAVTASTVVATMANGTSLTAGAAGTLVALPVAVGGTVIHGSTLVAVIQPAAQVRSVAAGEYSAIDVTPAGLPVVAYYDVTNQTIKIAHASSVTPNLASDWTLQSVMDAGDANYHYSGKYLSMKIDSAGYMHLAFYRNSTGDLVYLKSTNAPTDGIANYAFGSSQVVDSIGSVGSGADLTLNGTTPYLSYYDSSLADSFNGLKMAYEVIRTAGNFTVGQTYVITDIGTTDFTAIGAASNTVGLSFVATGVGTGTGTARDWEYMNCPLIFNVALDSTPRTSIEYNTGVTLSAGAASTSNTFWAAAIGYKSDDYYRLAYYAFGN